VAEQLVTMRVNGEQRSATVEPRLTLADFLRERCHLTGTHLGCEHGVCGACTVLVDGAAVRSCLMFAVQAEDAEVTTIEGIGSPDGELSTVQAAFRDCHGLQCGYCTPGFVISVTALLRDNPHPEEHEIREGLSGNLCRCTGYQGIGPLERGACLCGQLGEQRDVVGCPVSLHAGEDQPVGARSEQVAELGDDLLVGAGDRPQR